MSRVAGYAVTIYGALYFLSIIAVGFILMKTAAVFIAIGCLGIACLNAGWTFNMLVAAEMGARNSIEYSRNKLLVTVSYLLNIVLGIIAYIALVL